MGDSINVSGSKRKAPQRLVVPRARRRKKPETDAEPSGLKLRDGPPGHDVKTWELKRLRFKTSLGLLKYPVLGMPPLKPTENMVQKVISGVFRGIFRTAFLIPAAMLNKSVVSGTAKLRLDDTYDFLPEPLFCQDDLDIEERSFSSLYFISMFPRELPSFYFWLPRGTPPPPLRTHYDNVEPRALESESDPERTTPDVDDDLSLSPPSSYDSEQSSHTPVSEEETTTDSDAPENNTEDEFSAGSESVGQRDTHGPSDKRDLDASRKSPPWVNQRAMSLSEAMEGKRLDGVFPLFSCDFPPKLVHGRRGAIQIRDFRNFTVWESAVARLIGEKLNDGAKEAGHQVPREYLVSLWLNRNGRSELYCGWKMVPGQKDTHDRILNRLMTFPEMARERCVLRLHRIGDSYRLFPPPEFADGNTICLYNPYVGYSWVRILWENGDAWATNSRHFVSHLHWLFSHAGSQCYTRYAIEITGHGSFIIDTRKPPEAISKSLQRTLANALASATSPREIRVYNREFGASLVDSITMVRVARRRAVRSFRETNSQNFFGCFERLYHITNADWAMRVHPNDDHWARDDWILVSPETSIADRRNQFDEYICPLFRQYQNVIVSMCPRNIEVRDGTDEKGAIKVWAHSWEHHRKGTRIHHSAADLAFICKRLFDIDPRTDPPGVLILVSRWKNDKELLRWNPDMSDLEWRREVYYKIDEPDILVYPGNTTKESVYFGTFLDAVARLDADRNKYPPPRQALSETTGPEADWERYIAQIESGPSAPGQRRTVIQEEVQMNPGSTSLKAKQVHFN